MEGKINDGLNCRQAAEGSEVADKGVQPAVPAGAAQPAGETAAGSSSDARYRVKHAQHLVLANGGVKDKATCDICPQWALSRRSPVSVLHLHPHGDPGGHQTSHVRSSPGCVGAFGCCSGHKQFTHTFCILHEK